jgi:hypothetical protein
MMVDDPKLQLYKFYRKEKRSSELIFFIFVKNQWKSFDIMHYYDWQRE